MKPLRLLVLDAYAPEGRAALRSAGATEAGRLYAKLLQELAPDADVGVAYPADPDPELPDADEFATLDGIVWTGSSLTIHHEDDPRVARQLDVARAAYRSGVPAFGSCWAAQLAVVSAGGRCAPSPRGREFGVARRIELSAAGRTHPLFAGKPAVFDGFTSHEDEVVVLPPRATPLASNAWSRIQAVSIVHDGGHFWAVQYHPEYDLHEVASLCRLRRNELVAQGTYPDKATAERHADELEALHANPAESGLATTLGIGPDLLDPAIRTREVRNWLASLRP
jgi:GMP synthase (glutamine-hydrolysing)